MVKKREAKRTFDYAQMIGRNNTRHLRNNVPLPPLSILSKMQNVLLAVGRHFPEENFGSSQLIPDIVQPHRCRGDIYSGTNSRILNLMCRSSCRKSSVQQQQKYSRGWLKAFGLMMRGTQDSKPFENLKSRDFSSRYCKQCFHGYLFHKAHRSQHVEVVNEDF